MAITITKDSDPDVWEILNNVYKAERGPVQYVLHGGRQYRVMTPNGEDEPVFSYGEDTLDFYGDTSTAASAAKPTSKKVSPKVADVG